MGKAKHVLMGLGFTALSIAAVFLVVRRLPPNLKAFFQVS